MDALYKLVAKRNDSLKYQITACEHRIRLDIRARNLEARSGKTSVEIYLNSILLAHIFETSTDFSLTMHLGTSSPDPAFP